MAVLKKNYLPQDLQEVYSANGIQACVAVQADQSEEETNFLLELASTHDFILGVVGWVDLCAANIAERLQYYSTFSKLKGVRHVVQDEPDPEFMLQASFINGVSQLKEFDLTYDILIFPKQFKAALNIVERFPEHRFVLDHLAKPSIADQKMDDWNPYILELSRFPNVYCKVSGMVTEAKWNNWTYEDFVPYLDVVFEGFGVDRIMYGSDWPVCLLAGTYSQVKGILEQYLTNFSAEDQAKIWGGNAARFYQLDTI